MTWSDDMEDIMVAKMTYPPKVGIYCVVCGKLVREEYFTGNVDILVCDECKDAIAWAKEKMKACKGNNEAERSVKRE